MTTESILIEKNKTIKHSLRILSKVGRKCLIVVTKKNILLGTLSDGDIRKAILKGRDINTPIDKIYNKNPYFFL